MDFYSKLKFRSNLIQMVSRTNRINDSHTVYFLRRIARFAECKLSQIVSNASRSKQRRLLTQLRLLYVSNCLVRIKTRLVLVAITIVSFMYVERIHVLVMSGDKQSVLDWLNLCPAQSEGIICKRSKEQKIIGQTFIICTCLIKTLYL